MVKHKCPIRYNELIYIANEYAVWQSARRFRDIHTHTHTRSNVMNGSHKKCKRHSPNPPLPPSLSFLRPYGLVGHVDLICDNFESCRFWINKQTNFNYSLINWIELRHVVWNWAEQGESWCGFVTSEREGVVRYVFQKLQETTQVLAWAHQHFIRHFRIKTFIRGLRKMLLSAYCHYGNEL